MLKMIQLAISESSRNICWFPVRDDHMPVKLIKRQIGVYGEEPFLEESKPLTDWNLRAIYASNGHSIGGRQNLYIDNHWIAGHIVFCKTKQTEMGETLYIGMNELEGLEALIRISQIQTDSITELLTQWKDI